MAKAKKSVLPKPKKKGKYDITVKTDLTADQLFKKIATTTSFKNKKPK